MDPDAHHSASLFPCIAVEIVELITTYVDNDGLLDLRLTCRNLQEKTFVQFSRRFFSSIRTDLSVDSLGRIEALSRHRALSPQVRGLAFMLQNGVGEGLIWDRHPWGPLSAPLEIPEIARLRDSLVHRFTNCQSFFIFCRYPEGHPDMSRVTVSDTVAVFFALVVDAQVPVTSFHLVYANKYSRTLVMDMRRMPKLLHRQPQFKAIWSNLEKLSLEQYLTLDNFVLLLELVLNAPNLRTLLLNLGSHDLASEFMHEIAESAAFPHLEELALFRTAVQVPDLKKILHGLRGSLTTLTLYHVSLTPDENWISVLEELSSNFESLQSISLYYLWATAPTKELLSFPDIHKAPELRDTPKEKLHMLYSESLQTPSVLGIEYSGSKMPHVLRLLQATT
ncbi:Uncharacterized protein PECH_007178 [Penicillium ucsense]|uniref:F-box domain-containing protein n=1 Tax=Penicillium ucsense TaxID=2839758 RepID=A0A8J8W9E4_9EURO|nr:Uncharacterized protein PECM_000787 [Penicillium ucsense]KAF7735108.1 Uncharacterized protein PECH_007178 [Penicillium ucsense]